MSPRFQNKLSEKKGRGLTRTGPGGNGAGDSAARRDAQVSPGKAGTASEKQPPRHVTLPGPTCPTTTLPSDTGKPDVSAMTGGRGTPQRQRRTLRSRRPSSPCPAETSQGPRITVAMSSGPQRAGDVRAVCAHLGDSSSRHRTCRPGGLGYLLEDGLGHEHVHLAAEAPGGGVLHQHVGAALAVRRVQEVVPGLTVVLLCEGREAVSAAAPGRGSGFCVSPRSSDPPRPFGFTVSA